MKKDDDKGERTYLALLGPPLTVTGILRRLPFPGPRSCAEAGILIVCTVCRWLLSKVKLDPVGISIVCKRNQLAAVEKLELLAIRYVAVDFGYPALLDLDKIGIRWKAMVSVQCLFLLWSQVVVVVVAVAVTIRSSASTTTAAAAAATAALTSLQLSPTKLVASFAAVVVVVIVVEFTRWATAIPRGLCRDRGDSRG